MPDDPSPTSPTEFDALDLCHRQTLVAVGRLKALVSRLQAMGADREARLLAHEVIVHFAGTARTHHAEEERLVFPALVAQAEPELLQQLRRLQQDHVWLEEDWMELEPQLQAIAQGMSWWDIDNLRSAVEVFSALCIDHIALEESIIYPEAKARLAQRNQESPGRTMAQAHRMHRADGLDQPASLAVLRHPARWITTR